MGLEYLNDMRTALLKEAKEKAEKEFKEVSPTKLRTYYNEVLALKEKLVHSPNDESLWCKFYLLSAKVSYDTKRKVNKRPLVNEYFKNFIQEAVKTISERRDISLLEKFCLFFEAVVGFFPRSTSN